MAAAAVNTNPFCLTRPQVVLFGDSLTQHAFDPDGGWGSALAHHLQRKADVVNRGMSGYTTRWAAPLLAPTLHQLSARGQRVLLLVLWFGANDAALPGRSAERQHVPVQEYADNLAAMVASARAAGVPHVLLVTPPPVHDEGRVAHQLAKLAAAGGPTPTLPPLPDRTLEATGAYAAAVRALGASLSLPVVDLYASLQDAPGWQTALLVDGLHFSPAGARAVWRALRQVLETQLPQLSPGALPHQFPWHDQVDATDLDAFWATVMARMQAGGAAAAAHHEEEL